MSTKYHKYADANHKIESEDWVFSNSTNRGTGLNTLGDTLTFTASDIGRVAYQESDYTYWRLTATTPTWQQVGGGSGSGSGDFSSNTSSSVDGEVVLFSGTGGKTGKRATGSGIAKLTSGVLGTATSGTDYAPATSGTSILYGNGSGGFNSVTIGSGLSFSTGTLSATGGGSGTVTSVGVTVPSFLSASGSPVTTSGTIAISLAAQTANTVFAGPTTGSATTPTFRALVLGDIPSGVLLTANNLSELTASASTVRSNLGLVIGTDVAPATSGSSLLYGNGSGGFSSATVGAGLSFSGGTLSTKSAGTHTLVFDLVMSDGTSVLSTGLWPVEIDIPYGLTPASWVVRLPNESGSIVVDIRKGSGTYPTFSTSVAGSEKPTVSSARTGTDSSLSTWTALVAGDVLRAYVDSVSLATRAFVVITCTET